MSAYIHPEVLVETDWVMNHLQKPEIRIIESNEDALLYETGHIPGSVKLDWFTTLQDPVKRDFLSRTDFEKLCSSLGIEEDTTLVFYGDKSNWFAVYAFAGIPILWAQENACDEWRTSQVGGRATTIDNRSFQVSSQHLYCLQSG